MTQTIDQVMNRLKNLKEFKIEVDVPDGLTFGGIIPFDATISKNKGTFKVFALTEEEARQKVTEFLNR
jgi:hypothetical protein